MPSIATTLALGLLGAGQVAYAAQARQIWQFPSVSQWIENIAARPNGDLLLDTFDNGTMYTINPNSANATAEVAVQLPGVTGLTGIAAIAPDVFAVAAGVRNATTEIFEPGTAQIFTVDFTETWRNNGQPIVKSIANVTNTLMLNGLSSLPSRRRIVFSTDSVYGRIYRADTRTGQVDIVYQDELLTPGPNATSPFGANGIKVHKNYLYVTNTAQYTYGRIQIDSEGNVVGSLEILDHFSVNPQEAPDDLWIAHNGNAYVATHPSTLVEIAANGTVSVVPTGNVTLNQPTSMILSRNQKTLYLATGGGPGGKGGQVVVIDL